MELKDVINIAKAFRFKHWNAYQAKLGKHLSKPFKPVVFSIAKKKFTTDDIIILFSEGRGGSTWLMEILTESFQAINIFEPFCRHEGKFKDLSKSFSTPHYFGAEGTEEVLRDFLEKTFQGKESSGWTLQFNSFGDLLNRNKLVLKFCGVLLAPWMVENFSLKHKPVYLIRHPLAILNSKGNYGYDARTKEEDMGPVNETKLKSKDHPYWPHLDYLNSLTSNFERYIAEWCIRNQRVMGKESIRSKFVIVHYENLVLDPQKEYLRIMKELNGAATDARINFRSASKTANVGEKVADPMHQLTKWQRNFSEDQLNRLQEILDRFGVTYYNAFDALPNANLAV